MRRLSSTALSIALVAMSAGVFMPSAATAAKKEKAAEAVKLSPSKEFVPGAQEVQKLLAANDFAGAKAKLPEIEAKASKPDDQYFLGNFTLNVGIGLKDEALQRSGIEKMLASGVTPAADIGKFELVAGQLALNAKDYAGARDHLAKAAAANYGGASTQVYLAESYFGEATASVTGNQFSPAGKALVQQGLPYLRKAIEAEQAEGKTPDPSWYTRGLKMAALASDPSQGEWFKLALTHVGSPENWRIALRSIQDANHGMTRDESLDLLRLMASSKSLGNAFSYNEYAESAWKAGLPGEVKSVIDSGRSSGEINQSDLGELYRLASDAIAKDKASLPSSEKSAGAAATGRPAASTANAFLSYGDYAKAVALYRLALQKGGVDANEVNTRLGIALARSGDKAGALEAFGKVNGAGVRKQIADMWTVWLNSQAA
ncbi:MAG: hypothetical protein BGP16_06445 [Sphingobium sp. 66-54]|nr:MAG: hypothetical protein BGP16_06445 [Sphingobium sp. 66-54]